MNGTAGAALLVALVVAGGLVGDPGAPSMDAGAVEVDTTIYPPMVADPVLAPAVRGTVVQVDVVVTSTVPVFAPIDGDCESWHPLVEAAGITDWEGAVYVMRRESGCTNAHAYRTSSHDHSMGPFQVNVWGSMAAAWERLGFSHDYLHTPEGAVRAAAVLWKACGWSPWRKPYDCPGGWPL